MLEKEKIFSKFNVTDYNFRLEEILERKNFSEEAENLLLSLFYKIEGCYKDYETVKNTNITEKDFIEKLINIIDYNCDEIKIIKPVLGIEVPKYKILKNKKIIEVFPNEFYLLYAIFKISTFSLEKQKEIDFLNICISYVLNEGNSISNSEIIRDFTGWAWEIASNEIESIDINIFYKNIIFLLGEQFVQDKLLNKDLMETIEEKMLYIYGKEQSKIAIKKLHQFLLSIYSNTNNGKKRNVMLQIRNIENNLKELQNKPEFISKIKEINDKKIKKVNRINKILSNIVFIRKEFLRRNEILSDEQKIFSISHLVEILEAERKAAVVIINDNNNLINPLNYARKLNDVTQELKKYKELKIDKNSNADIDKYLIEFQKIFFDGMINKIRNSNTKKELISLIYELRYYNYLPYKNGVKLRFDKRISEKWEDVCIELIEKLLDNNIIDVMAENGKLNYDIVKYILSTKIMKIENIHIKMTKFNNKLEIEYYDGNTIEHKVEMETSEISNIKIKSERRIKLFI